MVRSALTLAGGGRPKRRWRSWPRSSPSATAAAGGRRGGGGGRNGAGDPGRDRRRALRRQRRADAAARLEFRIGATLRAGRWDDAAMGNRTVALVLAAGTGSRFGGGKLLAPLGGKPVLQHVLDRVAEAGMGEVMVVLGRDAGTVEAA